MPDTRLVIRAFGFLSILLLTFLWSPVGFSHRRKPQEGSGLTLLHSTIVANAYAPLRTGVFKLG